MLSYVFGTFRDPSLIFSYRHKSLQILLLKGPLLHSSTSEKDFMTIPYLAYIYGFSNGNGFAGISVGNFAATLIQAADGEFVGSFQPSSASIIKHHMLAGIPVRCRCTRYDFFPPIRGII